MYKAIYSRYRLYGILALVILFMTVVTGLCNQIGVFELLLFYCFQIFCIMIPGIAILMIMPIEGLRDLERVLLTYTLGYILTMLVYAVVMFVGGKGFLRFIFAAVAICAMVFITIKELRGNKDNIAFREEKSEKPGIMWIASILIVFFVSLIVFSLRWKIPYATGKNYYEADFLYWVKDIVATKKQVPPMNFFFLTEDYRYHYFGAFQQAVVSGIMGIPAIKVATCYSFIEGAIFFGLSSYVLMDRMIKDKIVRAVTILLLLFATGYEIRTGVTYIWHIKLCPMSYDIAQSLGIIVILLLLVQLEKKKIGINDLIVMISCLLCCTGTKTATGAVILGVICLVYAFSFLRMQKKKTVILYGCIGAIIFGLIGIYFWPTAKAYSFTLHIPMLHEYSMDGLFNFVYDIIEWIHVYFIYFVEINIWTFFPAVVFIIWSVLSKSIKKEHVISFIIIMIGTSLSYVINFYGYSHIYFAFMAFPFAAVLTGCLIERIFSHIHIKQIQIILAGLFCLVMLVFSLNSDYKGYFGTYFSMGMNNFGEPDVAEVGDRIFQVSYAERQAYDWIRENTEDEAFLLSDRSLENAHNPTGIFAERYVYWFWGAEDMEYAEACFNGDDTMLKLYIDAGIDYIVQTKRLSPAFYCPEDVGERVFDNEEVAVYKIY